MRQLTLKNLHDPLQVRISNVSYDLLTILYQIAIGEAVTLQADHPLKPKLPEDLTSPAAKMQASIYYTRYCRFIDFLLEEFRTLDQYQDNADLQKNLVDYYLIKNSLQELTPFGLGWFYDVKFRKHTATLYSVGYGEPSNWNDWIKDQNIQSNTIKENGLQLIFSACKKHINRGGDIRLKSLSKSFGVDLFKYMHLTNDGHAHVYIIQNAPINILKTNGKETSIYEYLMSNVPFDENVQFCLDFGSPRDKKAKNYNSWSKRFLGDATYISQQELNEKKANLDYELGYDMDYTFLARFLLEQQHLENGKTAISSRISPIADQEVIVSDTLWNIEDYTSDLILKNDDTTPRCIHFKLDKTEYITLIFAYFQRYVLEESKKDSHIACSEHYNTYIQSLIKDLNTQYVEVANDTSSEEAKKSFTEKNEFIDKLIKILEQQQDTVNNAKISHQVEFLLSLIDWESETFPTNWSLKNIYPTENPSLENTLLNLHKCFCKNANSL